MFQTVVSAKVPTAAGTARSRDRCDARVAAWYAGTRESDLFISVIVAGEIRKGVERLRPRDSRQAEALERWLREIDRSYADRILPIDARLADVRGRISAIRPWAVASAGQPGASSIFGRYGPHADLS